MKNVTITIHENGIVEIDLNGFENSTCLNTIKDFEFLGLKNENTKKKAQANKNPIKNKQGVDA
jgi:hypothetical protein